MLPCRISESAKERKGSMVTARIELTEYFLEQKLFRIAMSKNNDFCKIKTTSVKI